MEQPRPTLNIDDIVLLKSNPKEYLEKELEKLDIIEEDIVKHPVTERARNIGATGQIGKDYEGEDGNLYYDMTYSDGTKITYQKRGAEDVTIKEHAETVLIKDPDNKYDEYVGREPFAITDALENAIFEQHPELEDSFYISDDPVKVDGGWEVPVTIQEFQHTGKTIDVISSVTTPDGETVSLIQGDGYDFYKKYPGSAITDDNRWFIDSESEHFTEEAYGSGGYRATRNEYRRVDVEGRNIGGMELEENGHSKFYNIVSNNHIPDEAPSFLTVSPRTLLPKGQGVEKGVVTNDDYISSYMAVNDFNAEVQTATKRSWTVVTLNEKGNPARNGVQIRYSGNYSMFLTAPDQKFERRLIDEKNKIVIQTPYKEGMERHIWG